MSWLSPVLRPRVRTVKSYSVWRQGCSFLNLFEGHLASAAQGVRQAIGLAPRAQRGQRVVKTFFDRVPARLTSFSPAPTVRVAQFPGAVTQLSYFGLARSSVKSSAHRRTSVASTTL